MERLLIPWNCSSQKKSAHQGLLDLWGVGNSVVKGNDGGYGLGGETWIPPLAAVCPWTRFSDFLDLSLHFSKVGRTNKMMCGRQSGPLEVLCGCTILLTMVTPTLLDDLATWAVLSAICPASP